MEWLIKWIIVWIIFIFKLFAFFWNCILQKSQLFDGFLLHLVRIVWRIVMSFTEIIKFWRNNFGLLMLRKDLRLFFMFNLSCLVYHNLRNLYFNLFLMLFLLIISQHAFDLLRKISFLLVMCTWCWFCTRLLVLNIYIWTWHFSRF